MCTNSESSSALTDQEKAHIDLFKHWDASFWSAVAAFLTSQSFLFAALMVVLFNSTDADADLKWAGTIVIFGGFATTLIWAWVLEIKRAYVNAGEKLIAGDVKRSPLSALYGDPSKRTGAHLWTEGGTIYEFRAHSATTRISSARLVSVCLPTLFLVLWILGLILLVKLVWK